MAETAPAHDYLPALLRLCAAQDPDNPPIIWASVALCRTAGLELHPRCVAYSNRHEEIGDCLCMKQSLDLGNAMLSWDLDGLDSVVELSGNDGYTFAHLTPWPFGRRKPYKTS